MANPNESVDSSNLNEQGRSGAEHNFSSSSSQTIVCPRNNPLTSSVRIRLFAVSFAHHVATLRAGSLLR